MVNFSVEECNKIISLSEILPGKRREGDSDYRKRISNDITYKFWIIFNNHDNKWIFDRLDLSFEEHTGHKVVNQLEKIVLHEYVEGDGFERHNDTYQDNQYYNIGVNLTDDYEGGDFILYDPQITVGDKRGELYGFKNTRDHEVKTIKKGTRWSIIAFYFYKHAEIQKNLL